MPPIDGRDPDKPIITKKVQSFVGELKEATATGHEQACRMSGEHSGDDLLAWGRKYLPDHFSLPPSDMHRWMADQFDVALAHRGTKINVVGPRGGAKSTIGTLALPLRAAVECQENYIWIVSDTKHQASAHLENIKAELLDNSRLAKDFPDAVGRGSVWRSNSIVLRNGVTIEAYGTGQRIRGRRSRQYRPTLIVCDDLQNDGHIRSPLQREYSRDWFHGALLKAGTAGTNVVNLATALHRDALAMQLHRTPGWTSRIFKSIVRWPDNMSLWKRWEDIYTRTGDCPSFRLSDNGTVPLPVANTASPSLSLSPSPPLNNLAAARDFYETNRQPMDCGAILLWPEVEDLYTLMCMRAEGGRTAFEREKQNSPINPDLCEWPETYFDETIWFDAWPTNLAVKTMALDPSKGSDSRRGDYSALVVLGVDRQGMLYVEADLARRPTPEIVAEGVEWFRRHQPDVFAVEANQFQDLLAGEFEQAFRRQGILATRPMPIENHTPKPVRIRRLGPFLSSHRIRFKSNSPGTKLLVEQLQEFPIADHDDGPDALEMALRLAQDIINGRKFNDGLGRRLPIG
jgi:predicted phage terminase large subunit-like protein